MTDLSALDPTYPWDATKTRNALPLLIEIVRAARGAEITLADFGRVSRMSVGLDGPPATAILLREALAALEAAGFTGGAVSELGSLLIMFGLLTTAVAALAVLAGVLFVAYDWARAGLDRGDWGPFAVFVFSLTAVPIVVGFLLRGWV